MGFVVPQSYSMGDALVVLSIKYYKGEGTVLTGSSKTAVRQKDDRDYGLRQGIAEAIAEMLTIERAGKFPLFQHVEKIMPWEVQTVFQKIDPVGNFPNEEESLDILAKLHDLVDGKDGVTAEAHEKIRRVKILKGELKPEKKDIEWLEELRVKQENRVNALREQIILAERDPKVNDVPIRVSDRLEKDGGRH